MLLIEFSEGLATHIVILGVYLALIGLFGMFGIKIKKTNHKSLHKFKHKNKKSNDAVDIPPIEE